MSSINNLPYNNNINYYSKIINKKQNFIYNKIASICIPYYDLNKKLENVKGRARAIHHNSLNPEELNLLASAFMKGNRILAKKLWKTLRGLPVNHLKETIFHALENQTNEKKAYQYLEKFLESFDVEELKNLTSLVNEQLNQVIKTQTLLKNEFVKSSFQIKSRSILNVLSNELFYFIHHLLENLAAATGFADLGPESHPYFGEMKVDHRMAHSKLEFYWSLFTYPSVIFAAAYATLKSTASAALVTVLAVVFILLMTPIYLRYLKPCPNQSTGLENLNQDAMENEGAPIFKRMDILARIQDAFRAGKGVILTANPGEGKTSIVSSLAETIVAKECDPFLFKAQVFSANANQMSLRGSLSLDMLSSRFKRYKKEFVLFLDEIECLFKDQALQTKQSESLLTFHDSFKQVICATTTEQYNRTIKDQEPAFSRRFIHIEIDPLKDEEIEIALYDRLHFQAPELATERDVIPYILNQAHHYNANTSKIDATTSLLSCAIAKATILSFPQLEKEINDLRIKIELFNKSLLHGDFFTEENQEQDYQQAVKDLKDKEIELINKKNQLQKIKKIEKIYSQLKSSSYLLAFKIKKRGDLAYKKWLINQNYAQILLEFVQKTRLEIGLPIGLTKELIDTVIRENTIE